MYHAGVACAAKVIYESLLPEGSSWPRVDASEFILESMAILAAGLVLVQKTPLKRGGLTGRIQTCWRCGLESGPTRVEFRRAARENETRESLVYSVLLETVRPPL